MLETGLHTLPEGSLVSLEAHEPHILVVVKGVARVIVEGKRFELGPCTMVYLPRGSRAQLQSPWERVEVYVMQAYDMGPEPRILYNGYGVKSPEGLSALCVRVDARGVRLILPARVYPTIEASRLLIEEGGARKPVENGSLVRPPAKLVTEKGGMHVLLVLGESL